MSKHFVIIGNGVAGITCARHLRKRDHEAKITVVSSESKYFFSRTALMYLYMGHMKLEQTQPYENGFWAKNRIELLQAKVNKVDAVNQVLHLQEGANLSYDHLVLATGSKPNKFGWKGQELSGVGGLYSLQDLAHMEEKTKGIKDAVVVGGGLIGVEMAEMLHSRGINVHFLVREKRFWGGVLPQQDAEIVEEQLKINGIHLHLRTELQEIKGDEKGNVNAVVSSTGEEIPCQWVGLTAGVSPNIDFIRNSEINTDRGVLVNSFFQTNVPNIWAIGDCAQFREAVPGRRSIEQVWYTGKIMGEQLAKGLTGQPEAYSPGIWFNSAKFFDLEYQTYGTVGAELGNDQDEFYWENEEKKCAMHFVFNKSNRTFIGLNTFGIRIRHSLMDQWLRDAKDIGYVLSHLKDANFDPELYKSYEEDIVSSFNRQFNETVEVKKKNWLNIFNRT